MLIFKTNLGKMNEKMLHFLIKCGVNVKVINTFFKILTT